MGKNKHNNNRHNPNPPQQVTVAEPKAEEPIVVNEPEVVQEEVKIVEPEIVDGIVDGVKNMLNVRSTPEVADNVVTSITGGTKVKVVDPKKSTGDWFKIIVKDKKEIEGYAMKKYIKIL